MASPTHVRKPSVYVADSEYERLSNLAAASPSRGAAILGEELARAIILEDGEFPGDFVRLRSFVDFTDLTSGRTRRVQIVLPEDADIDQERLSVLTPVGAGLLGLTAGASIEISTDDGRPHVLQIRAVETVHEAA